MYPLLLCLDGGGNRGLSTLQILEEIVKRLEFDLDEDGEKAYDFARYFQLIGGTGTGGLISLMLGPLEMKPAEAIQAYIKIFRTVHANPNATEIERGKLFEQQLKDLVSQKYPNNVDQALKHSDTKNPCKTFVCAMPSLALEHPRLFRTYPIRENLTHNCSIWEAARATTAMPGHLSSINIGPDSLEESFVDGGFRCNNPTAQLINEAESHLHLRRGSYYILSIGAGFPGTIRHREGSDICSTALKIALDCEEKHQTYFKEWSRFPGQYYRLNVTHGMENFEINDWDNIGEVTSLTTKYLGDQEVTQSIDGIVDLLKLIHTSIKTANQDSPTSQDSRRVPGSF